MCKKFYTIYRYYLGSVLDSNFLVLAELLSGKASFCNGRNILVYYQLRIVVEMIGLCALELLFHYAMI